MPKRKPRIYTIGFTSAEIDALFDSLFQEQMSDSGDRRLRALPRTIAIKERLYQRVVAVRRQAHEMPPETRAKLASIGRAKWAAKLGVQ